ncbi:MAG: type I restriction endonuclease subunit R [Desulfovibrio sp.]|nr:MAG: type I restriction endonuclease subunit R [Desulfovibrio sp.]
MHDISLGITIRDYLTDEEIESTTFEDLRQGLARFMVEELGYPKDRLKPRVAVTIPIDGKEYSRLADLMAFSESGEPLLLAMFCAGEVSTYVRESVAAARLYHEQPVPLTVVTDSKDAILVATATGKELGRSMHAIPRYADLQGLAGAHPIEPLPENQAEKECRILYAYTETLYKCCSFAACTAQSKGAGFSETGDGEGE